MIPKVADPSSTMSDSSQLPTFSKQSVNGDRTSASTEPEVTVRQDGTVHLIYASYTAYFRDRTLLNAAKMSSDPVAGVPSKGSKRSQ